MNFRLSLAVAALAAGSLTPALAALPTGTLEFVERTGAALANERIAIVMKLTLDVDSAPLNLTGDPMNDFEVADLPTEGEFRTADNKTVVRPFASITWAYLNTFYSCQGNFTTGCDPSANYGFEFNPGNIDGHPSIGGQSSFALAAGDSYEFTFGFFVPAAGGAAPGVYRWNGTGVTLNFQGLDADGNIGNAYETMVIATGNSLDPSVAFTRTVTAVPEPATYAMLALGLAAVAGAARRRSAKAG